MRRIALLLILLIAALAAPATADAQDNRWLDRKVLNIAHQGGEIEAPSNTLYALKTSKAKGADVLEIDVHATKDRELVVLHDATVDRTTDGTGRVDQLSLAQIKALDAAHDFVPGCGTCAGKPASAYTLRGYANGKRRIPFKLGPYKANDFRIPTLREVLAAFPNDLINIEIKESAPQTQAYERELAALLKEFGRSDDTIVVSFTDNATEAFKVHAPEVDTAVGTAQAAAFWASAQGPAPGAPNPRHQALQVPMELSGITVVTPEFVERAHANGLAVHVWTINDRATMEQLVDMGVDGVMTDRPELLETILAERDVRYDPNATPATFEVGAAKALTNPAKGTRLCLGGYGACPDGGGRTMTGIKDDMYARAMAVSAGDEALILVHTTNIGLFASYKADGVGIYHLRQEVARRTGVPADHVIVQADHSHSAPDTVGIWGGVPESWMRHLQAQAVDAAVRAWQARRPARIKVGTADGPGITSSYESEPNLSTDDEFRMLWAVDRATGKRIVTLSNYSPHATVLGSSNTGASGDWPEWASRIAEGRFGGMGIAGVGTLGREDFGVETEADARTRLTRMILEANRTGTEVPASKGLDVRSVFITEPIAQPVLLLNLMPEGAVDAGGYDISIDRDTRGPWLRGSALGTYAGAARIGDVFFGMSPGEPFPEIQEYLRDEGAVTGARAHFHLGAANDFLGYMVRPVENYPQVLTEGAGYLLGCPEEEVLVRTGVPFDGACTDHWTLMVSPTIGSHVACTIADAGRDLGFGSRRRDDACTPLTATDGTGAPAEEGT